MEKEKDEEIKDGQTFDFRDVIRSFIKAKTENCTETELKLIEVGAEIMHNRFHKSCEQNNFNTRAIELYMLTEIVAVMKTINCVDSAFQLHQSLSSGLIN